MPKVLPCLFLLLTIGTHAQDTLRLEQAITLALENELGIRIAGNTTTVAESSATPGNAGLMPRLDAAAGANYNNSYSKLDFAPGIADVERSGVESTSWNASLRAVYTLFSGNAGRATLERLRRSAGLAHVDERVVTEGIVLQAAASYFAVAGLQENLAVVSDAMAISLERYRRADERAKVGGGGRLDVLNALVDLQRDSAAWIDARLLLQQGWNELDLAMGLPPAGERLVSRTLWLTEGFSLEMMETAAMQENAALLAARMRAEVAESDLRVTRATRMPRLDLNASYGVSEQTNEVGVILGNFNAGLNAGATFSLPIYDGDRQNIRERNARLRMESAELEEQRTALRIRADVRNAWLAYVAARDRLRLQRSAESTARVNFDRSQELYASGQLTGIQFRDAQNNLLQAGQGRIRAGFDAMLAELQLLRASGRLLGAVPR